MADLSGTILDGKYEIVKLLGEGGMGTVYEATHKLIGRRLAVKFLHAQYAASPEVVTRFQREAQAAAAIGHENIIEVTDMGMGADGSPYIVMEYLDGQDVKHLLGDVVALSPDRAAYIMVQALAALQAAHNAGIIHRDLKPENIYLITKGEKLDYVKLLDFGISKFRSLEGEGVKGLTQTGTVLGTPYYMSPEQARGDQNLSNRSDIYAMGVILFQMLTGSLPFDAPNYNALLIKILTEEPPHPHELNPALPDDLVETIQCAMNRDASARFPSCIEFRDRLLPHVPGSGAKMPAVTALSAASRTAVAAALGTSTRTPLEMTRSGGVEAPRSKMPLFIGIAAGVVLVAAAGLFFALKGGSAPQAPVLPANAVSLTSPEAQPGTPATGAAAVATPPMGQPAQAETIHIKISAAPAEAEIKVDGVRMSGNPFEGPFVKDAKTHIIEISAAGHEAQRADVRFDRDQDFSYMLGKLSSAGETRHGSSSKKKEEAKAAEPDKGKSKIIKVEKIPDQPAPADDGKKKKPRRKIDDDDPWG